MGFHMLNAIIARSAPLVLAALVTLGGANQNVVFDQLCEDCTVMEHGGGSTFQFKNFRPNDAGESTMVLAFGTNSTGCGVGVEASAHVEIYDLGSSINDGSPPSTPVTLNDATLISTFPVSEPLKKALMFVHFGSSVKGYWIVRFREGKQATGKPCQGRAIFGMEYESGGLFEGKLILDIFPAIPMSGQKLTMLIRGSETADIKLFATPACEGEPTTVIKKGTIANHTIIVPEVDMLDTFVCFIENNTGEEEELISIFFTITPDARFATLPQRTEHENNNHSVYLRVYSRGLGPSSKFKFTPHRSDCDGEPISDTKVVPLQKVTKGGVCTLDAIVNTADPIEADSGRPCVQLANGSWVKLYPWRGMHSYVEEFFLCGFKLCKDLLKDLPAGDPRHETPDTVSLCSYP